jgi:preprotein translocase subunit SecD
VNGLGVSEATVQTSGSDRIIVELPDVDQPEQALQTIRSTGKLELIDPQGQYLPKGQLVRTTGSPNPSLSGSTGVTNTDTISGTNNITATQELQQALSGPLYEVIADGAELDTASVQPGVDQGGRPVVSFEFTGNSATRLQTFTAQNIGKPLTIVLDNRVESSATIQDVLPGQGQISSQTTQDRDQIYNVLIFARLKEELRRGRSLSAAVEEGFEHAWPSIRDSNISTFITTLILYWFGSSFGVTIIKGFALTLGLSIPISVFTAVFITRTFLRLIVESGAFRSHWWYAVEEPSQPSATRPAEAL